MLRLTGKYWQTAFARPAQRPETLIFFYSEALALRLLLLWLSGSPHEPPGAVWQAFSSS
jgi:hypothetical protein